LIMLDKIAKLNNGSDAMAQKTMHDVARLAGVSISTVSRVLSRDASVEKENRARVEKAIQDSGYKIRKPARRNEEERKFVALIVPDITNPFYATIVKGIEQVARLHDYGVIVYDSEETIEIENQNLLAVVRESIRGLIYVSCALQTSQVVQDLVESKFPIVFLDRIAEGENTNLVLTDNVEGAYQAVKYLLRLGHRRIVYIAGTRTTSTERDRFKGYCQALEEEGIATDPALIVNGEYNLDQAYEGLKELIRNKVEFTAVFSSNDLMAFGVKQALEENNLRVPADVSIVGYDDINFAHAISLTVISQPIVEMGQSAMTLLLNLIQNRITSPQRIVHRPSLIIRNSCQRR